VAQRVELARCRGVRTVVERRVRSARLAALQRNDAEAYGRMWRAAAEAVGAEVEELGVGFLLIRRRTTETVVQRNLAMIDHPASIALSLDKVVMSGLLAAEGIPMGDQVVARRRDISVAAQRLAHDRGRWVVKPGGDSGGGRGVTVGVETSEDLWRAWLWASVWCDRIVMERLVAGEEFRLLFLDGELLDVVHRRPATVVGDGESSVAELIDAENQRRVEAGPDEVGHAITIDLDCLLALRRGNLKLRSVVPKGTLLTVKGCVSDSGVADSTTTTDIAPEIVRTAAHAVRLSRLRFAGVDVLTPDRHRSLEDGGGVVIEVNGTPGLAHHVHVQDSTAATPVAEILLERLLS
jgi:D-alanine-D-alanine ligase-like ATP-grasp enzyme